jgi:hypothetical protein
MIFALRRRHRRVMIALAVLLPIAFTLALFLRKPLP